MGFMYLQTLGNLVTKPTFVASPTYMPHVQSQNQKQNVDGFTERQP